jgi:hypothetical protein
MKLATWSRRTSKRESSKSRKRGKAKSRHTVKRDG